MADDAPCGCHEFSVEDPRIPSCLRGFRLERELGRGDIGVAYLLSANDFLRARHPKGKYVLKQVNFRPGRTGEDKRSFIQEVCIGKDLGALGIAPKIYECWLCHDSKGRQLGFYTMDKMKSDYRKAFGGRHAPQSIQRSIIGELKTMIEHGFIHNDNHPGNIGVLENGKVVLFDFGFTKRIPRGLPLSVQKILLAYSLYQIIEQYEIEGGRQNMYGNLYYQTICRMRGQADCRRPNPCRTLRTEEEKRVVQTVKANINDGFVCGGEVMFEVPRDLDPEVKTYLLAYSLYYFLEGCPKEYVYDSFFYDLIYKIRQGHVLFPQKRLNLRFLPKKSSRSNRKLLRRKSSRRLPPPRRTGRVTRSSSRLRALAKKK